MRKISFDHTLNSFEEIKNVDLSEKDKLTQAIGAKEELSWYCATDTLKGDEKFFICTDGVYKYTEEEDLFSAIKALLLRSGPLSGANPSASPLITFYP